MGVNRYEDLEIWQIARILVGDIYSVTSQGRFGSDFAMRDQIRSAAISVMSNIAEGFGRTTPLQFRHLLDIARASCLEVQSILYAALDLGYVSQNEFDRMYETCRKLYAMISALMRHLKQRSAA